MLGDDEIRDDYAPEVGCIGANCIFYMAIISRGGDAKGKEGILVCVAVGVKVPRANDVKVHAAVCRSALEENQGILHDIQQLHGMSHLAEPIGDVFAIGIMVKVDGQIDEIGDRLPAALETFFLQLVNIATGPAQGGTVQVEERDGLFDIFIRNVTGNVKLGNEVLEFGHLLILSA